MLGLNAFHQALLRMEPETAHEMAIDAMRVCQTTKLPLWLLERQCSIENQRLEQHLWGTLFRNPVGLAAGYDKNGQVIRGMAAVGFGFLEVGTVTPMPQRGNAKPRIFRLREFHSLRNSLGFNNRGGVAMRKSLRRQYPFPVPVGINIGKNRNTRAAAAKGDYEQLVDQLSDLADYLVVNVSSPNTPGLRDLQRQETIVELVNGCRSRTDKPVLVKLAPDLDDDEAVDLVLAVAAVGAAGIVVTNTTTDYSLVPGVDPIGGLSGRVLRRRSLEMLRLLAQHLDGKCKVISVGGIESAADAYERLKAGASLVQVYTAMIYQGPLLVNKMIRGIVEQMDRDGFDNIEELIGAERDK